MSKVSFPPGSLTLRRFAKRLGYRTARDREFKVLLKILLRNRLVEIQQSGYAAHSKMHPKLIVVLEPLELENFQRINNLLRVNFKIGDFTVHRATKKFKCADCSALIYPGERYGSSVKLGRYRRRTTKRRPILSYEILCLPCLILKYDEMVV